MKRKGGWSEAPRGAWGGVAYSASDDMGNVHQMVINNISEVVRREPVTLYEYEVVLLLLLLVPPIDPVHER